MLRATAGSVVKYSSDKESSGTDTSSIVSGKSDGHEDLIFRQPGGIGPEDDEGVGWECLGTYMCGLNAT